MQEIAEHEGWRFPEFLESATVRARTTSGRVATLVFAGKERQPVQVSGPALRLAVGRSLGWNVIRSDAYDLHLRDGVLVFDGHGYGHGVGLCQQGATEMARTGKGYREILAYYFPGTDVRLIQADHGWQHTQIDGIALNSTSKILPADMAEAANAWQVAKSRFPPAVFVLPSVTFTPSTEVFRQLTAQPGWQAASTSGDNIVLQPKAVLAGNRMPLREVLQHEMLHVAVETSASVKSPLWLREGLVEVLAGEAPYELPMLTADATEQALKNAATKRQNQAAHLAAGARVRELVQRYGMSTVRGWLASGSTIPSN